MGLALGPAWEKLAPEEPPEKRAVLMGPMDPPQPGAPPSFLPHGKVPLRGEEGLVADRVLGLCTVGGQTYYLISIGGWADRSLNRHLCDYRCEAEVEWGVSIGMEGGACKSEV